MAALITVEDRCRGTRFKGFHELQCSRRATREGFCHQHHPDAVNARKDASWTRYEAAAREANHKWRRVELERAVVEAALAWHADPNRIDALEHAVGELATHNATKP